MAVTSQQIADLAGVSRGTVDRALHNRGRVSPEVAARISRIAEELGYRPNILGQALSRSRQDIKLGVILQSAETPTIQDVARSVHQMGTELQRSGVEMLLRTVSGLSTVEVLRQIDELVEAGIKGLAITPNSDPKLTQRIDGLSQEGIPVVTLNSDLPNSQRICYIGMDSYRAGQTAAELLHQMLPSGGKVLPMTGHLNNTAHNNRLNGFLDTFCGSLGNIELLPAQPCFDRDDYAREITLHLLQAHPNLSVIYVVSNGQQGVCHAIEEAGLKGAVRVIAYDLNAPNRRLLQDGSLSFVLDQGAFEQGTRPLQILYNYLLYQESPPRETIYTDIQIYTKYNISKENRISENLIDLT